MTVHGAKGLQAPVVILADTMQVPLPDNGLMWNTESDAEGQAADVLLWAPAIAGAGTQGQEFSI